MAAKEYKVSLPNGAKVVVWANSAEQAARRAEKEAGVSRVVNQKRYVSNRSACKVGVKGYDADGNWEGDDEDVA